MATPAVGGPEEIQRDLTSEAAVCAKKFMRVDEPVKVYRQVISEHHLGVINAAIDRGESSRGREVLDTLPGGVCSPQAVADLLRRIDAFRMIENEARRAARLRATQLVGRALREEPFHTMRCVGAAEHAHSHRRHFDSHLLTLLVPLQLADPSRFNGDLLFYTKRRQSVSLLANVAYKFWHGFLRNLPFAWRCALTCRDLTRGRCERVPCAVGNVYVFNGFVTQHCNLHVESGERRSLLIHYYDPGLSMGLSVAIRTVRGMRDRLHRA
ncbi:hypothetical protein B0G84_3134 [Paraburkholderia sp. BL8N3]|nr:hypothetical protein B0G84_3134 [Paraburkholderia sp. BL8N3]